MYNKDFFFIVIMSFAGSGSIVVKPMSAKLTRDTEFLGKMDPYCVIKIGA